MKNKNKIHEMKYYYILYYIIIKKYVKKTIVSLTFPPIHQW